MYCDCENPEIHIVNWSESTWGLEKKQYFKECLKCIKIIANQ